MRATVAATIAFLCAATAASAQSDPLPSWRNRAAKASIIEEIVRFTTPGEAEYLPAAQRVAVFDQGDALWSKHADLGYQPMIELVALLRRSGFETSTVSAGSAGFIRVFIGRRDRPIDQVRERDWIVVDLKRDWKVIYPPQPFESVRSAQPMLPEAWLRSPARPPFIIR